MQRLLIHATVHLIVTLAGVLASAAGPKLSISVNRSAAVGTGITVNRDEPVTLELATDPAAKLAVFVVPKINFDSTSDGRKVIFFAKQSCTFLAAAFDVKTGEVTKVEYTITVGNAPVPPPPGPVPPPGPNVPTSAVGKAAYEAAMAVDSPTRAADAAIVAKGMRAVHAKAVAVATMTGKEIINAAIAEFAKIPDASKKAWVAWGPKVFVVLTKEVGDTPTREKAIAAVEEMAKGLEAVR